MTTAATTTVAALWAAVAAAPDDDSGKLALADALREAGDGDTATTVQWLVQNRLWPQFEAWAAGYRQSKWRSAGSGWCWRYGQIPANRRKRLLNCLPDPLYRLTRTESDSLAEAVAELTTTFQRLWSLIPQRLQ